jgi:hypothetical protein
LHSARLITAIVRSGAIDDVKEGWVVLVEHHFKVRWSSGVGVVHHPPLNGKLPVRRGAGDRGENPAVSTGEARAAGLLIRSQIALIGQNGHVPESVRQGDTAMGVSS